MMLSCEKIYVLGKSFTDAHDITRELLPLTTNSKIDSILNSFNDHCYRRTTTSCGGGYAIIARIKILKTVLK